MTKKAFLILLFIFILCVFSRLFKFATYFTLGTDQAQAFTIAEKVFDGKETILLGYGPPQFNIVAPTYHLIVTLLFYLFRNEFLVTLVIVLISIFTVLILFALTTEISGIKTALLASLLYSVSNVLTYTSRDLPHPMVSFFLLLSFYFLFKNLVQIKSKYLVLSFIFFLFSLMYISTYLLIPAYLLIFFAVNLFQRKIYGKKAFIILPVVILLFSIFYLPVFYYHYLNNFKEFANIPEMLTVGDNFLLLKPLSIVYSIARHLEGFAQGFFQTPNELLNILLFFFVMAVLTVVLISKDRTRLYMLILSLVFISGLILAGIYPGQVYMHRLIVFFPIFIILFSSALIKLTKFSRSKIFLAAVFIICIVYIYHNQKNLAQFLYQNEFVVDHLQKVADFIAKNANNKPYSILLITPHDQSGYYSLEYIYALKKLPAYQIPIRMDIRGELYYDFNPDRDYSILICKEFSDYHEVETRCLNVFLNKYGWRQFLLNKKIDTINVFVFENNKQI